jgi:hypothetical protein
LLDPLVHEDRIAACQAAPAGMAGTHGGFFLRFAVQALPLFDGWPGWFYVMQRLVAEMLIALEVIAQRWRGTGQTERSQAL